MVWNATDRSNNVAEARYVVAVVPAAGCFVTGRVVQASYSLVGTSCAAVQLNVTWETSRGSSLTAIQVTWDGVTREVTPTVGARSMLLTYTYISEGPKVARIRLFTGCATSSFTHAITIRPPTGTLCKLRPGVACSCCTLHAMLGATAWRTASDRSLQQCMVP
jgi:hypothetical protein